VPDELTPTERHEIGRTAGEPTEDRVLDDDVILMPVRPWTAEITFTVLDHDPAALAAALHDAGEPHLADICSRCQAEALRKAFRELGEALAKQLAPALDAFRKAMEQAASPQRPAKGPTPRLQRAPRDHPSNTGLAAHSRTSSQTQRNALRRL
jgi:hypothetical protein